MQKNKKLALGLMAILATVSITSFDLAYAQTTSPSPSPVALPASWNSMTVLQFAMGVIWAGFGYAVALGNGEKFDPKNFFSAVVIGVLIATVMSFGTSGKISPELQSSLTLIFTIVVDKIFGKKTIGLMKRDGKTPQS